MIPYDKIEQIREAVDIIEIVLEYVKLKKGSEDYFANCPFHSETIASFCVSPKNQLFYCFGCKKTGTVINFIEFIEKLDYYSACLFLIKKYDLPINIKTKSYKPYYTTLKKISTYYHTELFKSKDAISYLENRKINAKTIKEFKLGYALDGLWFLTRDKPIFKILLELKIIKERNQTYYDFFKQRVVIPILSERGQTIGLIGASTNTQEPKYLNSADSIILKKAKIFLGLSHAKKHIEEANNVILVEGVFDFLSLYSNGIKNVVASLGTGISATQARILGKYTKKVTTLYDSDTAGMVATTKVVNILIENEIEVEVAFLEAGEDPDSYIHKYGKEKLLEKLKESQSVLEFWKESYDNCESFSKKKELIDKIIETINKIKDTTTKSLFQREVERIFGLKLKDVSRKSRFFAFGKGDEEELLRIYLKNEEERTYILTNLKPEWLLNNLVKAGFEAIRLATNNKEKINVADIIDFSEEDTTKKYIAKLSIESIKLSKEITKTLEEDIRTKINVIFKELRKRHITIKIQTEVEALKTGEGDKEKLDLLLKARKQLQEER